MTTPRILSVAAGLATLLLQLMTVTAGESAHLSPAALAASPDGRTLYVACATDRSIAVLDTASRRITGTIPVPESPLGLALSRDGRTLHVACDGPNGSVCFVDLETGRITGLVPVGHTALSPVLSPGEKTLFVCARFDNRVVAVDLATRKVLRSFAVPREPVAVAVTPDGRHLLVANHLHAGRADADVVSATVTVIALETGRAIREIRLPNGSTLLRDIRVSPDGRHAVVTHLVARFHLPTTQIERGWINTNALSLIDLTTLELINTVLLDNIDSGAANPWAAAWTGDGRLLAVTHAGTHEVSLIQFPALLARLKGISAAPVPGTQPEYRGASRTPADVPNDLAFLVGLRERIRLDAADRGPRGLVFIGSQAWTANYFSDTVSVIDLADSRPVARSVPLGPCREPDVTRRGEFLFNDASICFQGWQSCASCHSSDARVDGMNWDNLNDGIGNPKNSKSLLQAHATPPSMWLGVRGDAHVAVRAGIRNSLFTVQPEDNAVALDVYLKSLKPVPSPHLVDGRLSPAAERGRRLFFDTRVGCAECHTGPHYTDRKLHNVGTLGRFDKPGDRFDTPGLIEAWRTAPYLHDGRATTIRDVLTTCNPDDRHGETSHLTPAELDDLAAFVLSL